MNEPAERRASQRYTFEQKVRYRLRGVRPPLAGTGTTVNMSSAGVLFTIDQPLPAGKPVILEINWPVRLGDASPLKLVARGRVIWCDEAMAATSIEGWDFRTQGVASL
jgi:hypothetical protein